MQSLSRIVSALLICALLFSCSACAVENRPPVATAEVALPTETITDAPAASPTVFDFTVSPSPSAPEAPQGSPTAAPAREAASVGATPEAMPASLDGYFTDAAFIGDSVTLKLRNYAMAKEVLGNTLFLTVGSFSVAHAVNYDFNVSYQGADAKVEDALREAGCQKVFIMLGLNDIALYGTEKTIENWDTMIGNIRAQCPNIKIFIQSATPIWKDGQKNSFTNANFDAYNVALKKFASENNCTYIDLASYLKDETGGLAQKYCSDEYVHLTDAACEIWVNLLRSYAE